MVTWTLTLHNQTPRSVGGVRRADSAQSVIGALAPHRSETTGLAVGARLPLHLHILDTDAHSILANVTFNATQEGTQVRRTVAPGCTVSISGRRVHIVLGEGAASDDGMHDVTDKDARTPPARHPAAPEAATWATLPGAHAPALPFPATEVEEGEEGTVARCSSGSTSGDADGDVLRRPAARHKRDNHRRRPRAPRHHTATSNAATSLAGLVIALFLTSMLVYAIFFSSMSLSASAAVSVG